MPVDGNLGGAAGRRGALADRNISTGRYGGMSSRIACSDAGLGDTAGAERPPLP